MKPEKLVKHPGAQLLDVRLADDFEAAHLAGAVHNCVFEVSFGDRLAETAPDPSTRTFVYGENEKSQEADAAAEKLRRHGYQDVHVLDGGLHAARLAGLSLTEGTPLPAAPPQLEGRHPVDLDASSVTWTGRNLLNKHYGQVALSQGHLEFESGLLSGGSLTLDLTRLDCTDLAGTPLHEVLIAHLRNDDFFDVENHPEATLILTKATPLPGTAAGAPNLKVSADLTLRGQTHPITFQAASGRTPEGLSAAQATLSIDRTRWGVLYGSGKFFHRLAGHLVNDLIDFDVKIVTSPPGL